MYCFFLEKKEYELYYKYRKQYLFDAIYLYKVMLSNIPDANETEQLKEKIIKRYKHERKELNLNASNSFELYKLSYPIRAKVYKKAKNIIKQYNTTK